MSPGLALRFWQTSLLHAIMWRDTVKEPVMSDATSLPLACFPVLVQLLASQAMLAMGKMQVPGEPEEHAVATEVLRRSLVPRPA